MAWVFLYLGWIIPKAQHDLRRRLLHFLFLFGYHFCVCSMHVGTMEYINHTSTGGYSTTMDLLWIIKGRNLGGFRVQHLGIASRHLGGWK